MILFTNYFLNKNCSYLRKRTQRQYIKCTWRVHHLILIDSVFCFLCFSLLVTFIASLCWILLHKKSRYKRLVKINRIFCVFVHLHYINFKRKMYVIKDLSHKSANKLEWCRNGKLAQYITEDNDDFRNEQFLTLCFYISFIYW